MCCIVTARQIRFETGSILNLNDYPLLSKLNHKSLAVCDIDKRCFLTWLLTTFDLKLPNITTLLT